MRVRGLVVVVGVCFLIPFAACKKKKDDAGTEKSPPSSKAVDKTAAETPPVKKKEWTAEQSIAAFEALQTASNKKDFDSIRGFLAADLTEVVADSLWSPKPRSGADAVIENLKRASGSWTKQTFTPQLVIGSKDAVLAIVHHEATTSDKFPIEKARGKSISALQAELLTFDADGKINKIEILFDESTALHQVGIRPSEMAPDREEKWATPIRAAQKDSETEAANVEATKQLIGLFQGKIDPAKLSEAYAEKSMTRFAPMKKPFEFATREAKLKKLKSEIGASETKYGKTDIWAAGDWVAVRVEATYVWPKGYPIGDDKYDKKSAGKETSGTEFYFYRFEGGKIAESHGFWNDLHFQAQAGLFDPATLRK